MKDMILHLRGRNSSAVPSFGNMLLAALMVFGSIAAGWGILNFPAVKVLAVGVGALCIIAAAWKIELALYGVGVFLVMLQEAETTPGTLFTLLERLNKPNIPSLLEVLFAVIAAAFIVRCFVMNDERYSLRGMKLPLALYGGLLFLSFMFGILDGTDYILRKEDLKRFVFPVLFFVSAVNILDTREKVVRLLTVMFGAMLAKACLADFYYLKGLGFAYGDSRVAFLESGDQILVVTIIVAVVSIMSQRAWDLRQWLYLGSLVPMFFALLFSYRRNALWGAILSLGLLVLLSRGRARVQLLKVFACAGIGAICLMALLPAKGGGVSGSFLTERLVSVVDRDQSSNRAHMNEWTITIEDTMKSPVFGLGLGAVHGEVPEFELINRHTVHNAFLMLWMKMGAIPVVMFLWLLFRYVRMGVREASRRSDPLFAGLFATCALWVISMNAGPAWFYYRESCLVALIMSAVVRLGITREERLP